MNRSQDVMIFPDFAGSQPTGRFYRQSCVDFFNIPKKTSGECGISEWKEPVARAHEEGDERGIIITFISH